LGTTLRASCYRKPTLTSSSHEPPQGYYMMRVKTAYANPSALVSTNWMNQHLDDADVRLLEVDVNTTAYERGHIRGAGIDGSPVSARR
jgi:hypothetical protein